MSFVGHFDSDKEFLVGLHDDERKAFSDWFVQLNRANNDERAFYVNQPLETATGIECWYGFFKRGLTPQEALGEDLSCAG